jgi:hypothetical protein
VHLTSDQIPVALRCVAERAWLRREQALRACLRHSAHARARVLRSACAPPFRRATAMAPAAPPDARGRFFFLSTSLVVACFLLHCLPLAMVSRTLGAVGLAAYRTGFLAAAAAHGYRVAYTLRPKLAAAGGSVAALQAAAPVVAKELLASNSFLVRLHTRSCDAQRAARRGGDAWLPRAAARGAAAAARGGFRSAQRNRRATDALRYASLTPRQHRDARSTRCTACCSC